MNKNNLNLLTCFFVTFLSIIFISSCNSGHSDSEKTGDSTTTEGVVLSGKQLEAGAIPFDFPKMGISSQSGDYVLCPSFSMWKDKTSAEDPSSETYIYYTAQMSMAGEVESEIDFTFDGKQKMPNSIIIPIPARQKAQKGDIVLTWWQTGSGMQRAIVVDAGNPEQPIVRYLDLDYDNPATDSKSGKSIGQTDYELLPNSFVKIANDWQAGNMIAAKDETWGWVTAQIISIVDQKVLTIGFAGKIKVYAKSDCIPMPINPIFKTGDKVKVVGTSSFVDGEIIKTDAKIGRIFVKTATNSNLPVAYGEIIATLPEE